jgi:D-aminopeptidase
MPRMESCSPERVPHPARPDPNTRHRAGFRRPGARPGLACGRPTPAAAAAFACVLLAAAEPIAAQTGVRARDLGVPFDGTPGRHNAITDVAGVEVGHVTLRSGDGRRVRGVGPIRTGVTAILPRGRADLDPVFAAWFNLNGNGEITGTAWIEDSGFLNGPLMLTNTFSVGTVRDAVIAWQMDHAPDHYLGLPVVGETSDAVLNDRAGFHVRAEHAHQAIASAAGGPVAEGAVGAGTGTICHQFKAGIGTASRTLAAEAGGYTVGVLVQCNYGARRLLQVAGVPVGRYLDDLMPCHDTAEAIPNPRFQRCAGAGESGAGSANAAGDDAAAARPLPGSERLAEADPGGSIIIVVATDAPLLPHQLHRVARRAGMGLALMGSIAGNSSGDLFLAFSTANPGAAAAGAATATPLGMLPNGWLDPIFEATVQATEEAILNSMIAAETVVGADFIRVHALPHDRLQQILRRYNRLDAGR